MAKVVPPPLGVGMIENTGYLSRAWLQWFQDLQNNTAEGLVELTSGTLSADSTLPITTGISSLYDHYKVLLSDIKPSQPNDILNLTVSTDTGTTYETGASDYSWLIETNTGSVSTSSDSSDVELTLNSSGFSNTPTMVFNGTIDFFTPSNTSNGKWFRWDLSYFNNSGTLTKVSGTGMYTGTSAIDALKLYFTNGKFTSGSYKLYGIK